LTNHPSTVPAELLGLRLPFFTFVPLLLTTYYTLQTIKHHAVIHKLFNNQSHAFAALK